MVKLVLPAVRASLARAFHIGNDVSPYEGERRKRIFS